MTGGPEITSWAETWRVPRHLAVLAEQEREVSDYAREWVARRDGFEPSPVCVLRPLAGAMDLVSAAFDALDRRFAAVWADAVDDVESALAGLEAADLDASASAALLHRDVAGAGA